MYFTIKWYSEYSKNVLQVGHLYQINGFHRNVYKILKFTKSQTSQDSYFLHTFKQGGNMGGKVGIPYSTSPQIQEGQSQDFDWTMNYDH